MTFLVPDLSALVATVVVGADATPSPSPTPSLSDDSVTPGVVGFFVTAAIVVVVVFLILDMVRRMRRVRYREEARERIAAELDQQASAPSDDVPND